MNHHLLPARRRPKWSVPATTDEHLRCVSARTTAGTADQDEHTAGPADHSPSLPEDPEAQII